MVDFICQLDCATRCPGSWLNVISGCVCEDFYKREYHPNAIWVTQVPLPVVGGHHPVHRGNEQNQNTEGHVPLPLSARSGWDVGLLLPLGWDLHHWRSWFSGLWARTGTFTTDFSASPACKWQRVGLLSPRNPVRWFLKINMYIYIYVYIYIYIYTHIHT